MIWSLSIMRVSAAFPMRGSVRGFMQFVGA